MNNKTLAVISYITILGWLISFFSFKDQHPKNALVKFHLKQAFGLFLIVFCINLLMTVLGNILPAQTATILEYPFMAVSFIYLILMIIGAINASKEEMKPLPLIGNRFVDKFSFI